MLAECLSKIYICLVPHVVQCQQGAESQCAHAGDHLAVLPKNTHHITRDQLVRFGRHLGITPLSDVFDLELLEGSHEPVKPFPLPNTYEAVLSGEHCLSALTAGISLQKPFSKQLCSPSSADVTCPVSAEYVGLLETPSQAALSLIAKVMVTVW